ncbi:Hemopexin-like domain-containing protein [Penicillium pulvis]|uniref:Hemopexin-like domain-containing protein n=1 Tax=Penicillium pulvis TaxID=1562058 RepID=UPI002546D91B|nr:Hemopexin-like domain-containing protein [Penicillium pulvis]KAJ5793083.1 Hemopexin-like domain-containing protein [Penicillium pulvis]
MICIRVIPGTIIDKIIWGSKPFATAYKALAEAGFTKIDAILPVPAYSGQIWVFSGTQYARLNGTEDTIVFGPAPIAEHWPSLVQAGFPTVNAVFPTPGESNHAYVFHEDRFARITLTPGTNDDKVYFGPAPLANHWPVLVNAKITSVDAVIPTPGFPSDGYFFSGEQFMRLTVTPNETQNKVVFGPAPIQKHWPCLKDL